mmetsp:Transcript_82828/g.208611  ORF Transcript_82828/g.208611 Transcript_82828/m.208611 type:complete len:410 (-) Transcript_82828:187-1416(-)
MKDFSHTVRLTRPVNDDLHRAFTQLLMTTEDSMNQIAAKQAQLQQTIDDLTRQNQELRAASGRPYDALAGMAPGSFGGAAPTMGSGYPAGMAGDSDSPFKIAKKFEVHEAPVHSVNMATSGDHKHKIFATASWDASVKIYDVAQMKEVQTLKAEEMGGLYAVAFAKTVPEILGCTSCDHSVYLWNHTNGKKLNQLKGHSDEVNGIDFHWQQQVMCTASDDSKCIIWDFQEGIVLRTLDKHTKAVYGCTFLGVEHQYFVGTCCFDQKTRIFDMRDKQVVALLQSHEDDIIGIDYSADKSLLATGSDDGTVAIWDTRTWKQCGTIDTRPVVKDNEVKRIAFSTDGKQLAAACSSGKVLVYDMQQAEPRKVAELDDHTDCVFDVTWGIADGRKVLVTASHDKSSIVYKADSL